MTPDRVDDYLASYLVVRPSLRRGKFSESNDGTGEEEAAGASTLENTRTNIETIRKHRKALNDLYNWQRTQFPDAMNTIAAPKTSPNWRAILSNFEKGASQRRRVEYGPRGVRLIRHGYDEQQHLELCEYGLKHDSVVTFCGVIVRPLAPRGARHV